MLACSAREGLDVGTGRVCTCCSIVGLGDVMNDRLQGVLCSYGGFVFYADR